MMKHTVLITHSGELLLLKGSELVASFKTYSDFLIFIKLKKIDVTGKNANAIKNLK